MYRSRALALLLVVVGIILFLFISLLIGVVVIIIALIVDYFGRKSIARMKQAESPGVPPPPPLAPTGGSAQNMAAIQCKNCGTLNDPTTTNFCSQCGARLN